MPNIHNGGLALAAAIFFAILLLLILLNWVSSSQLLYDRELGKALKA
jgi:hypothetical protein